MYFYDTETCGFHGPIVLMQYAYGMLGDIKLHSVWNEPISDTMAIIEDMMDKGIIGFNLAFDQFHINQLYNVLRLHSGTHLDIDEYRHLERKARDGVCLKPRHCLDLMMHARKGPYQSTMNRKDIEIKRVPTALANGIVEELNRRIVLPDIYFEKQSNKAKRWQIDDIEDDMGRVVSDFKNISLRFKSSSALKALCIDIGLENRNERLIMDNVKVADGAKPEEIGYAPFADSVILQGMNDRRAQFGLSKLTYDSPEFKSNTRLFGSWPQVINVHISHWSYNSLARKYAYDDVKDTRNLFKYFSAIENNMSKEDALKFALDDSAIELDDYLHTDDDDSVLSCMVGAIRWKGFNVDVEGMERMRIDSIDRMNKYKELFNHSSPATCIKYLHEVMSESEKIVTDYSSKGIFLEEIATWKESVVCEECLGMNADCKKCFGTGMIESSNPHPAASRAKEILFSRHAKKEVELFDKMILAGRFHASFVVIGTKSTRMAGTDGFNPQGVKRSSDVRSLYNLVYDGECLDGGDFDGFEMSIMDAVFKDPRLHEELQGDKKIHAIWGERYFFPHMNYDSICATKGLEGDEDKYLRSKNGVFAFCYFGEDYTFNTRVGIPMDVAEEAFQKILEDYPVLAKKRDEIIDKFCSMKQPNGIGTKVEWHEPDDFVESMFGFRRYFTLENQICKVLFDLAENPPEQWNRYKIKVKRRERVQTACGAVRTALFAAAFGMQGSNMRAAGNHKIQSTGAQVTKRLQRRIWDLQPIGVSDWFVRPLNIHDEIMSANKKCISERVKEVVNSVVEEYKEHIPLISMKWKTGLKSWGEK